MLRCCRVYKDVGVKAVHLSAIAVGPDLTHEFLGPLWGQAGLHRKLLVRGGQQHLVQLCGLLYYDLCPRAQDVGSDKDRDGSAMSSDRDLLARLNSREQFGQRGTGF
jgi:hypothetical protein